MLIQVSLSANNQSEKRFKVLSGTLQPTPLMLPLKTLPWKSLGISGILNIDCSCSLLQFSSVTQSCSTLCDPMDCSTPGLPVHHQLLELTHTHVHWFSDDIQQSHPLSSPSPPTFNLSQHQGLFKWVSSSHQVTRVRSFSVNISPSNEHLRLISFRIDWLDLLAIQGTLKGLLQHHSSKASILWRSAFFIVQLSYPYMTTGKTKALTRWTFVGKVMSLLLNMLSRLVITFLPRNKHLLGKSFNITVIQVYAPASNAEEAEIEWFYEDL